jgi:hypothetical protein
VNCEDTIDVRVLHLGRVRGRRRIPPRILTRVHQTPTDFEIGVPDRHLRSLGLLEEFALEFRVN